MTLPFVRSTATLRAFLRQNPLQAGVAGALLFVASLLSVLLPLSVGSFFRITLQTDTSKDAIFSALGFHPTTLKEFLLLFASLVVAHSIATYGSRRIAGRLTESYARDLLRRLFERQMRSPLLTASPRAPGYDLLRYSGDLRAARNLLGKGILQMGGDVFLVTLGLASLFCIEVRLAWVAFATFTLSAAIAHALGRPISAAHSAVHHRRARLLAFVSSRLHHVRTVKMLNRETPEISAFQRKLDALGEIQSRENAWDSLLQAILPSVFYCGLACSLALGHIESQRGSPLGHGQFLSFALLFLYLRSPIRRLVRLDKTWQSGLNSLRKLHAILDRPIEERTRAELPAPFEGNVELRNVSFAYHPGEPVVQNFNARFAAHSLTRITGPRGSGRSTVLALIAALHKPQSGVMFYDDMDSRNLCAFAIRKEVTLISDDAPLLGDTILDAITYDGSERCVERAVRALERLDFSITGNPTDDLRLPLHEGGANLSRGQRRMLQFARALVTRKTVILLDEPFQDLDACDVERVIRTLHRLRSRRTLILVANSAPDDLIIDQALLLKARSTEPAAANSFPINPAVNRVSHS